MRIEKPVVSVVMPVFNGASQVGEALESVLKQSFKDFEVVVVNDCSTDNTVDVVNSFKDERIILVNHSKNLGAGASRNTGVKHSTGEFVAFLSADDLWKETFLEVMLENAKGTVVFCNYFVLGEKRRVVKEFSPFPEYSSPHVFAVSYFHELVKSWGGKNDMFVNYSGILGLKCFFEGDFKFFEGTRYGEDLYHLLKVSKSVPFTLVPKPLLGWMAYKEKGSERDYAFRLECNKKVFKQLEQEGFVFTPVKAFPKVLVAAPTSIRHAYCIDKWIEGIRGWDYPKERLEVVVVDNTPFELDRNEEFYARLKNLGLRVVRFPWNRVADVTQMLATCREIYRQIAYFERFDYIFHLDTDTTIAKDGLKVLLSRDKDQIGLPVHVYPKQHGYQPPCVFKKLGFNTKGLYYYTWRELHAIKEKLKKGHKKRVFKVAAAPLGVLLVKRKVFEMVPFTSHAGLRMGEDVWYHNNCSEKGFGFWIDFTVKVKHRNTDWDMAQRKGSVAQRLWVAFGPEGAKGITVIDHARRKRTVIDAK